MTAAINQRKEYSWLFAAVSEYWQNHLLYDFLSLWVVGGVLGGSNFVNWCGRGVKLFCRTMLPLCFNLSMCRLIEHLGNLAI